ncbi:MAG: glycosyltransferase, partial [Bacteroidales bacterium]|nr:glycosyltransferase [Bacteroidales bacterium]
MKLSVICPILNEERYIVSCIESILKQDYPKQDMEVLFVDGMSVDATRRIILEYSTRYPFFRLLDNPLRTAPCAMNIGIKEAKGEIVLRIDAHTSYAENYFSCLCRY